MKPDNSEARFDVKLTLKAGLVGPLMAFLDGKYDSLDIRLLRVIPNHSNLPKGQARAAAIEILQKAGGHMETRAFKAALTAAGLTKMGADNFVYRKENREFLHRKGKHIWLKKGATI